MIAVDTNVLVRLVVRDDDVQARRAVAFATFDKRLWATIDRPRFMQRRGRSKAPGPVRTNILVYTFDETPSAHRVLAHELVEPALTTRLGVVSHQGSQN